MKPLNAMTTAELRLHLQQRGDRERAQFLQGFFKTGPGGYGEGDVFLGIRVPELRKLVSAVGFLTAAETVPLLQSAFHEERLFALLILVRNYVRGTESAREAIYRLVLANTIHINNWDLVDATAPAIVGAHLRNRSKTPLHRLAASTNLWERRMATIATLHFIRHHQYADTLQIAELLFADKEDLIHKAVGWMLREVGKRDLPVAEAFLDKHWRRMPRIMLRYAIEKFPEGKRRRYIGRRAADPECLEPR